MRRTLRNLVVVAIVAAGALGSRGALALDQCAGPACIAIDGVVTDPHGNPAPQYQVDVQRADGFHESTKTNASGWFFFKVPLPTPNNCYQIVGRPDAYYTTSNFSQKACSSTTVDLQPKYRTNGVTGYQKVYLGDIRQTVTVPVSVSALSRTYPAPFHHDHLPWLISHRNPSDVVGRGQEHVHHGSTGHFDEPVVRKIANGVWQYLWSGNIVLPEHVAGFYDLGWGGHHSVFSPMMDCRMVWFGFGTASIAPSKALPGTKVSITGQRFGSAPGAAVLKGQGQVTRIEGAQIVTWTDSKIEFLVPPTAKSGWVTIEMPSGVTTNAQPLTIGA